MDKGNPRHLKITSASIAKMDKNQSEIDLSFVELDNSS